MRIATRIGTGSGIGLGVLALALGGVGDRQASASEVTLRLTVTNLAPSAGVNLTPVWFGFHNGGFDLYDPGTPASTAIERIAEDGNFSPLADLFAAGGDGDVQGAVLGAGAGPGFPPNPVIAPGDSASVDFTIDSMAASSRYFSYASMIVPSNDFFIANGDPLAFEVFDDLGRFLSNSGAPGVFQFTVLGSDVLDAGTEVNDEVPSNVAFFGQAAPDTGDPENGVVSSAGGFIPDGAILSDSRFANAQYTASGYEVARIQLQVVPEPATALLCGLSMAVGGALLVRRRRGSPGV